MHKNSFSPCIFHRQQDNRQHNCCWLLFIKPETNVAFMEVMSLIWRYRMVYIISLIRRIYIKTPVTKGLQRQSVNRRWLAGTAFQGNYLRPMFCPRDWSRQDKLHIYKLNAIKSYFTKPYLICGDRRSRSVISSASLASLSGRGKKCKYLSFLRKGAWN